MELCGGATAVFQREDLRSDSSPWCSFMQRVEVDASVQRDYFLAMIAREARGKRSPQELPMQITISEWSVMLMKALLSVRAVCGMLSVPYCTIAVLSRAYS